MYRLKSQKILLAILTLILGTFSIAEDLHEDTPGSGPAPIRRDGEEKKEPSVDELKEQVSKTLTEGTRGWWDATHKLFTELKADDSDKFVNSVAAGKRQDLLRALHTARFKDSIDALRNKAITTGGSIQKDAAVEEVFRRVNDPNAKLVAALFHMRPERAIGFVDEIEKAQSSPIASSGAGAEQISQRIGKEIAKHMGTLNKKQREALLENIENILKEAETNKSLNKDLFQKLKAAAEISLNKKTADDKNAFEKAFDAAYKEVLDSNKKFFELLEKAKSGDPTAKAELLKNYDPESLMDFMSGQMKTGNDGVAVDLAQAIGRKDEQGNFFLDMSAKNAGFGEKDRNQVLLLGKDAEEMRAALTAFHLGNAQDHGETGGRDVGTSSRFQRFAFDPGASRTSPIHVFAGLKEGKPELKRSEKPGRPSEELAKEKVLTPSSSFATLTSTSTGTTTGVSTGTGTGTSTSTGTGTGTGGLDIEGFKSFIAASCLKCHPGSTVTGTNIKNAKFKKEGGAEFSIKDVAKAADKIPKMKTDLKPDVVAKLKQFAAQQ